MYFVLHLIKLILLYIRKHGCIRFLIYCHVDRFHYYKIITQIEFGSCIQVGLLRLFFVYYYLYVMCNNYVSYISYIISVISFRIPSSLEQYKCTLILNLRMGKYFRNILSLFITQCMKCNVQYLNQVIGKTFGNYGYGTNLDNTS